jgi:hypothetical protein
LHLIKISSSYRIRAKTNSNIMSAVLLSRHGKSHSRNTTALFTALIKLTKL